ncbi:MAG: diadenylate cyclase CdaA [Thermonemataceae bacterium]|nr:diadenylate cyclase CdaA [Thermonemataceae bacterium]
MVYLFKIWFVEVSWIDIIDILLVSYLVYQFYKLLKGSVAIRILIGIVLLSLVYLLVNLFQLKLLGSILGQFFGVGVIAMLILFQQEIRKFLLLVGRSQVFGDDNFWASMPWRKNTKVSKIDINAIVEAARAMSSTNTGALLVFARSSDMKFYADSGDMLDATLSKRLLLSIFNKFSPLHDGAVIIGTNGRIVAARCILPVSENDQIPASMGLRHRSAIGISEVSDAIVMIVSEETGQISLAKNGQIQQALSYQELRNKLNKYLSENKEDALRELEVEAAG